MAQVMPLIFTVTCLLYLTFNPTIATTKYSTKEGDAPRDRPARDDSNPNSRMFRSKKANLIWTKALKMFENKQDKLDMLQGELKDIDDELMKLKVAKFDNMDPFGEMEAAIDEKVNNLLKRFSLGKHFDTKYEERVKIQKNEMDNKLQKLMEQARDGGFSNDELRDLETEVTHHRHKMAQLEVLEEQLKQAEAEVANDRRDNTQEKRGKVKDLRMQVKEEHKALHSGIQRLSLLSDTPAVIGDTTFSQPKMIQLWGNVLKANFTEEERESLKVELLHLEKKLNKKAILEEDMSVLKKKALHYRPHDEVEKNEKVLKKHEDLMQKSEHLDRTVRKHVKDLENRISSKLHTEL